MFDFSRFNISDDQNTDEYIYKHTYQEEELVVKAIMDGNAADAVRISERLDRDSGRLGDSDLQHRKLNAVVAITVCSRAAIRAGVSPIIAYKISGFYINKCDNANDTAHMLHYRNRAIEDLCTQVTEAHEKQRSGSYVRRCMDYVGKNYRYKIYLEDIAESMGISPSYLSRLFHSETGEKLQDYISRIRVMRSIELLLYSEMSLSEIAEYVGFPNQSYFGKMFRKYMSTTPRIYRDIYKVAEASSKE
jgi:YesN/AraC family two-component response regulator